MSMMQMVTFISILFVYELSYAQSNHIFIDSRDSSTYKIVPIGTQTWMAENLNFQSPDSWCYADSQNYCAEYGRLYTWEAAKNACPDGWHLPSEEEWQILEEYLGMAREEIETLLMRGGNVGTKLKSKNGWEVESRGNPEYDIFGFNALPGGYRLYYDGSFVDKGKRGSWWTSTPDGIYAMRRTLFLNKSGIDRDPATRTNGYSVRCIKD